MNNGNPDDTQQPEFQQQYDQQYHSGQDQGYYGQYNQYGQQADYSGAQYANPEQYDQQDQYGHSDQYGQDTQYDQHGQYVQHDPYVQQNQYGVQEQYDQNPQYDQQGQYGQQDQYNQHEQYGQEHGQYDAYNQYEQSQYQYDASNANGEAQEEDPYAAAISGQSYDPYAQHAQQDPYAIQDQYAQQTQYGTISGYDENAGYADPSAHEEAAYPQQAEGFDLNASYDQNGLLQQSDIGGDDTENGQDPYAAFAPSASYGVSGDKNMQEQYTGSEAQGHQRGPLEEPEDDHAQPAQMQQQTRQIPPNPYVTAQVPQHQPALHKPPPPKEQKAAATVPPPPQTSAARQPPPPTQAPQRSSAPLSQQQQRRNKHAVQIPYTGAQIPANVEDAALSSRMGPQAGKQDEGKQIRGPTTAKALQDEIAVPATATTTNLDSVSQSEHTGSSSVQSQVDAVGSEWGEFDPESGTSVNGDQTDIAGQERDHAHSYAPPHAAEEVTLDEDVVSRQGASTPQPHHEVIDRTQSHHQYAAPPEGDARKPYAPSVQKPSAPPQRPYDGSQMSQNTPMHNPYGPAPAAGGYNAYAAPRQGNPPPQQSQYGTQRPGPPNAQPQQYRPPVNTQRPPTGPPAPRSAQQPQRPFSPSRSHKSAFSPNSSQQGFFSPPQPQHQPARPVSNQRGAFRAAMSPPPPQQSQRGPINASQRPLKGGIVSPQASQYAAFSPPSQQQYGAFSPPSNQQRPAFRPAPHQQQQVLPSAQPPQQGPPRQQPGGARPPPQQLQSRQQQPIRPAQAQQRIARPDQYSQAGGYAPSQQYQYEQPSVYGQDNTYDTYAQNEYSYVEQEQPQGAYGQQASQQHYEDYGHAADQGYSTYDSQTSAYAPAATGQRSNDPAYERQNARIPLACFALDGKFITHFPSSADGDTAYGYGNNGGPGSGNVVTIRSLSSLVPPTSYAATLDPVAFAGPLFEVGGSQIIGLSRAAGSSTTVNKSKKNATLKQLQVAIDDLVSGIGYLHAKHSPECDKLEDRILLMRILYAILEHDGAINGNAAFDQAVIQTLMADDAGEANRDTSRDMAVPARRESTVISPRVGASLVKVENLLAEGKRKEAVNLASDNKLWTHAVIIASGMDKETWRDVVSAFIDEELNEKAHPTLKVAYTLFSGQEPKALYDMFRPKQVLGNGAQGAEDDTLHGPDGSPAERHEWRRSVAMLLANRNAQDLGHLTAIGDGLLRSGWIEAAHVCYLLSPQTANVGAHDEMGARITLLGTHSPAASTAYLRDLDAIMLTEIYEFALSLRPIAKGAEPFQGLPYLQSYRMVHALYLAGMGEVKRAQKYCDAVTNVLKAGKMNSYYHTALLQHLQELTERLHGDGKSNSPTGSSWAKKKPTMDGVWGALENRFTKFIAGEDETTAAKAPNKATEAVGAFTHFSAITPEATSRGVSRTASYADFSNTPLGQSHTMANTNSSSYSRPDSRTSATGTGAEPQGRFGNGLAPMSQAYSDWPAGTAPGQPAAAPSNETYTDNYAAHKRAPSSSDVELYQGPYRSHATGDAPWDQGGTGLQGNGEESTDAAALETPTIASVSNQLSASVDSAAAEAPTTATEWQQQGSPYGYEPHGAAQPQFVSNVEGPLNDGLDAGSEALSGAPTPVFANTSAYTPTSTHDSYAPQHTDEPDEEDDLGLSTRRSRPSKTASIRSDGDDNFEDAEDGDRTATTEARRSYVPQGDDGKEGEDGADEEDEDAKAERAKHPELKPAASWFGRLWTKKPTPEPDATKAVRANLGETSSFYFDKDLKRWVNKKTGDTGSGNTTPPPPPRTMSASPSVSAPSGAPPPSGSSASGSAKDLAPPSASGARQTASDDGHAASSSAASTAPTARQRSNLGDPSQPAALQPPNNAGKSRPSAVAGSAAAASSTAPPPPKGPAGGAKKKPINKRYVRVD
jgi:hypothetical protein